jgi:hypothetical protein
VKNTLVTAVSISAVLLFISPVLLVADSISTGATVSGDGGNCSNTGTTNAACQASFTAPFSGGGSASATGSLATGVMGAQANYLMGNGSSAGSSRGSAELNYDFVVSNGPASGTLVFFLSASGSGFVTVDGCGGGLCNSSDSATIIIEPYESFIGGPSGTELGLGNGVTLFEVATKYGPTAPTPQLVLDLESVAICNFIGGGGPTTTCNASSDFLDTVAITGAQVYDSSGNLVNGATLVSDTGFNPNAIPSTVPEPGSFLLFGTGLVGVVSLMRRKIGPSAI